MMMTSVKPPSTTTVVDTGAVPLDSSSLSKSETVFSSLPGSLEKWFDLSLPEGRCIGVKTTDEADCFPQDLFEERSNIESDHWLCSAFHPDELDFGRTLKKSRNEFWLGRLALRTALDFPDYPILKDEFGRPRLKEDLFGSISHKPNKGVAILSPLVTDPHSPDIVLSGVGVDLEVTSRPGKNSIAKRILTENERQSLGNLPGITVDEEVLLRFSLKEAIYKAAHPLLRQYVGFQEAEVTPHSDGTASCTWLLDSKADRRIAKLTAHWEKFVDEDYFLTSSSVYAKSDEEC
jgi:phosphopantetheine--protein transferase-like protein